MLESPAGRCLQMLCMGLCAGREWICSLCTVLQVGWTWAPSPHGTAAPSPSLAVPLGLFVLCLSCVEGRGAQPEGAACVPLDAALRGASSANWHLWKAE